jgi:hypothetical protein
VSALDQLREQGSAPPVGPAGAGTIVERLRSSRRLVLALVLGVLLLIAWIAWAVYVTSDNGAEAGLGVVIAWPALLAALALISLPFIAAYLLVQRIRSDQGTNAAAQPDAEEIADGQAEAEDEEGPEFEDAADDEEADEATFKG